MDEATAFYSDKLGCVNTQAEIRQQHSLEGGGGGGGRVGGLQRGGKRGRIEGGRGEGRGGGGGGEGELEFENLAFPGLSFRLIRPDG